MQRDADIHYYLSVLKRRKWHIAIAALITFAAAAGIVSVLPSIYKSSGTILIETQEIPKDFVQSTVTGYAEDRLQMITRVILSRTRLLELIDRFGLYVELKGTHSTEEIIQRMRKDIVMKPLRSDDIHRGTIAFTLSYEGKDPELVSQVTGAIIDAYLFENRKSREEQAQGTFEFLEKQIKELRAEISHYESRIAEFKDRNIGNLPELMQFNLQSMDRLDSEIRSLEDQIKNLVNRKIYLEKQMASVQPMLYASSADGTRVVTPRSELIALRLKYLSLSTTLAEDHPDVIALKKRLNALEKEVGSNDDMREFYRRFEQKELELNQLLKRLSPEHPDVIKLQKEVDRLKTEAFRISGKKSILKLKEDVPDNPAYISLQTQVSSTRMEIDTAQRELKLLKSKYADYQNRVASTPQVELEYLALLRDYKNAQEKYQETRKRLLEAREAKELERSRMAEKFTLIEKPVVAKKPYKPQREKILLSAMVLSLCVGMTIAFLAQHLDQSIRSSRELAAITNRKVLGVIPFMQTAQDLRALRHKRIFIIFSLIGTFAAILAVNYFFIPLNAIWRSIK